MTAPTGKLRDESSGEEFALGEVSVIGRSPDSSVPISDPRVSRRHAMIRRQADGFWFFDLGSINGSQVNDRRVTNPRLLETGDLIQIAGHRFRFDGTGHAGGQLPESVAADRTIAEVCSRDVVLLVSDIQGFTTLSERLPPDQIAPIISSWHNRIEATLDRHGATIDKFIGDCVLAYWPGTSVANRRSALTAAHEMMRACEEVERKHRGILGPAGLEFRSGAAIHLGKAACGAFGSRESTLLGDAVNLVFRLEALTRQLDHRILLSSDVLAGWSHASCCFRSLGSHPVKGRDQPVEVYALVGDPDAREDEGGSGPSEAPLPPG